LFQNPKVQVQLQRTCTLLQIRFCQLIGKEYKPKHPSNWVYSENPRTTASFVAADEESKKRASLPSENSPAKSDRRFVASMNDSG
jgi:hypothetical protein